MRCPIEYSQPPIAAAVQVLSWFQEQLLELEPGPLDPPLAFALTRWRDWALTALGAGGWAKREQIKIGNGRPLAICTGGGPGRSVPTDLGRKWAYAKGCFRVFAEAPNISGKKWPRLCPDCQPRSGHRQPNRDAEREIRRRIKQHLTLRRS